MVKLVANTSPLITRENGDKLTPEDLIVYIARVSNPNNQLNTETSSKLIRYLIKHNHWSPFEHISLTLEIKTSRAIAAQLLRHRSFTFQEFSQRYSQSTSFEDIEWRLQGKTNRQVGDEEVDLSPELKDQVDNTLATCKELYDNLIDKGLAKECARMVLPLCTSTTLYMTGTLRSWIHYLELRTAADTQKEHRYIAVQIEDILMKEFPNVFVALQPEKDYN